ncbi:MAG: conjugal transfer protein TraO [Bacteroidetes bacterium]|nr:conjugal transfer protein TraO [Fibrella sp.]
MKNQLGFWLLGAGLLIAQVSNAQRHIQGQRALSLLVGAVDNWPRLGDLAAPGSGYMVGTDYVRYAKNERYWKASFSYVRKYYAGQQAGAVTPVKPVVEQYWLSLDYVPRGIVAARRWLYVSPTLGVYAGYESVNRNKRNLADGLIMDKSTASIGPQVGLESEVYLGPSMALVGGVTARYIPFSEVATFRTTGYVGIRYCFF